MESRKKDRNLIIVASCLAVILIAGIVSLGVMNNNGKVLIKEVTISPYGGDLAGSMYIPKSALETDKAGKFINTVPAVIVNAGFTNSRTYLDNVAIELARCGFAVFQIDMYGHGHSEIIDNRGFAVPPSPFTDDTSLCGADDALAYLRTLGFVDQTRIGMCGHSLGGAATGRMAERYAGFYTLQDELLNMLSGEFGVSVTEAQVTAQDADAVAAAALNADTFALYEMKKAQIVSEYERAPRDYLIFDAGAAGCDPHAVEVAGISVWRDVQANLGLVMNLSGNGGGGLTNKDAALSSAATLMMLAVDGAAKRDTWYQRNLSGTAEVRTSTELAAFYSNAADPAIQAAAGSNSLRMLTTPFGWHGFTYLSVPTAKAAMQFFSTGLAYNNGDIVGGGANGIENPVATHWIVKDLASAIGFIALIILILPLVNLLMSLPFFASMHGAPPAPAQSKKSSVFWVVTAILVALPVITYSKGTGWGSFIKPSPLSTVQLPTQVAFWSILMTAILLAILIIKYNVYDKKKFGIAFRDMYGLRYSGKNIGKSIVLALCVFGFVSVVLTVYYNLFGASNLKITPGGAIVFTALSKVQYYNWLLYAIYFLPFYLFNGMMVNSARFNDMGEKASMWIIAAVNAIGMFILACIQFLFGYVRNAKVVFATPPGSSALVYMLSFFFVMLFVSAIFNRKLYSKTGSSIPGALLNVTFFTIPAIQVFMYYAFP